MFDTLQEVILLSTVLLTFSNGVIGTGFLVFLVVDKSKNLGIVYLVSNKHLLSQNQENDLRLKLHKKQAKDNIRPKLFDYDEFILNIKGKIIEHPRSDVDLAIIDVTLLFNDTTSFYSFEMEKISDFSCKELLPCADIFFVGYPRCMYDHVNNLPIVRKAMIATHPKIDFNDEPHFIIDGSVYEGSSGSPVFMTVNNDILLVGIIVGTYKYSESIQTNENILKLFDVKIPFPQEVKISYGLGIVLKSSYLLKLLTELRIEKIKSYQNELFSEKDKLT